MHQNGETAIGTRLIPRAQGAAGAPSGARGASQPHVTFATVARGAAHHRLRRKQGACQKVDAVTKNKGEGKP